MANYKGGVQYIDFMGTGAFTSGTSQTVTGTHAKLLAHNKKRTVFQNFTVGDANYPDIDIPLALDSDGTFSGTLTFGENTLSVSITNADAVTFTVE